MIKLVTFTSDFGTVDSYVSEVKGVIKACDLEIEIIDITHWIEPGNLTAASFVLLNSFRYFKKGTVHLAVIDPGVGSDRDIIAVKTKDYVFIGPDNGILYESVKVDGGGRIYALAVERFIKKIAEIYAGNEVIQKITCGEISTTFQGRDLFAPFTGYILGGRPLEAVAVEKGSMIKLEITSPVRSADKVCGKIIYIDRFGNLISNIKGGLVSPGDEIFLKTRKSITSVGTLKKSYSNADEGRCLSLIGSRGFLEIALNRGNAKDFFEARYGDEILILKQAKR